MFSPRDIKKRIGVCIPFFNCVCLYFALDGGGEGPSVSTVALKCAPVLCLLLAVALHQRSLPADQRSYSRRVCCGLALSALGDALLVWEGAEQLRGGMALFGGAHLAYLAAFCGRGAAARLGAGAGWLAGAALYVWCVAPPPAAALYAALLAAVAWRAAASGDACARAGAALFLISDALLGCALYAAPVPHRRLLVMSTYYMGQLGIALSALRAPHAPHAQ